MRMDGSRTERGGNASADKGGDNDGGERETHVGGCWKLVFESTKRVTVRVAVQKSD